MSTKKDYAEQISALTPAYVMIKPKGPFILPIALANQVLAAMPSAVFVKYDYESKGYVVAKHESFDPVLSIEPISLKQFAETMLGAD